METSTPHTTTGGKMSVLGWIAVVLSLVASGLWAFWGSNEAFHEGWWASTFLGNLRITFTYLLPAIVLVVLAVLGVRWPRVGGPLHIVLGLGIFAWWVFLEHHAIFSWQSLLDIVYLAAVLLAIMGLAFLFGRPQPRGLALGLVVGVPLAIALGFAVEPFWRVTHRPNDGLTTARQVAGNGVELIWAPAGPGWPERGTVSWAEAQRIAAHLNADGLTSAETPQNIWRLPTVDEAVRSLTRNGQNAGGVWEAGRPHYQIKPDKESPLWNVHSPVIYWWTSTPASNEKIYTICYNGSVLPRLDRPIGTLGFRAVKNP